MTDTSNRSSSPVNARAQSERALLCDLFEVVGPDAPTLCEGWATRDLAAHLIVREGRLDTSFGIFIPPLRGWTDHVIGKTAKKDWATLIGKVRNGPPRTSMMRIASVDGAANTLEFAIHHEDVRRAVPDWTPRDIDTDFADDIWARLAKFGQLFRNVNVGVTLARPNGATHVVKKAPEGHGSVTLTGEPLELALRSYGRMQSQVTVSGDDADVAEFEKSRVGF
jgi:uncharacterized protein (TIGR03085 family)